MLTARQVGERLGEVSGRAAFSRSGVVKYIQKGLLKAEKVGNLWVVQEEELERFLSEAFPKLNLVGGRPRVHAKVEKRSGRAGHGNIGKKYRKREQQETGDRA